MVNGTDTPLTLTPEPFVPTVLTVTGDPPLLVTVTVCVPDCPTVTVPNASVLGLAARAPAVTPVPLSVTLCGLPVALSAIESVPVREPVVVGLNVTLTVQFAPAAKLVPQLFVCEKSPVVETEVMLRLPEPLFVTVTVCAALATFTCWLPKVTLEEESETDGVGALVPVPLNVMVCGLPVALSAIDSVPVRLPVVVGLKVTLTVQFAPAARLLPQVFVCEKSPVAETDVIVKLALPVFEIVMV